MTSLGLGAAFQLAKGLVPGLMVTALVAMAAAFLGSHYKGSMLLFALLLPGSPFHQRRQTLQGGHSVCIKYAT